LGIGDWGFGVWGDAPQPQNQTPNPQKKFLNFYNKKLNL